MTLSQIPFDAEHPPLAVGQIYARDGCWQRKYRIAKITKWQRVPIKKGSTKCWTDWIVEVEYLGEHFADGRKEKVLKVKTRREIMVRDFEYGQGLQLGGYILDKKMMAKVK